MEAHEPMEARESDEWKPIFGGFFFKLELFFYCATHNSLFIFILIKSKQIKTFKKK